MNIFRAVSYYLVLFLLYEAIAVAAVSWSFFESVKSSFVMLKYTSENSVASLLKSVSKLSEPMLVSGDLKDMDGPFRHFIKKSEQNLDRLRIKEIFILSSDGVLLAHSDKKRHDELGKKVKEYNQALYSRADELSKWTVTSPVERESHSGAGRLERALLKKIPDLKNKVMLISAPVYHPKIFKPIGSVHMVYVLDNYAYFIQRQKDLYFWIMQGFVFLSFAVSVLSFLFYLLLKDRVPQQNIPPLFQKVVMKTEEIAVTEESPVATVSPAQTGNAPEVFSEITPVEADNVATKKNEPEIKVVRKKEIMDAIYLGKS